MIQKRPKKGPISTMGCWRPENDTNFLFTVSLCSFRAADREKPRLQICRRLFFSLLSESEGAAAPAEPQRIVFTDVSAWRWPQLFGNYRLLLRWSCGWISRDAEKAGRVWKGRFTPPPKKKKKRFPQHVPWFLTRTEAEDSDRNRFFSVSRKEFNKIFAGNSLIKSPKTAKQDGNHQEVKAENEKKVFLEQFPKVKRL